VHRAAPRACSPRRQPGWHPPKAQALFIRPHQPSARTIRWPWPASDLTLHDRAKANRTKTTTVACWIIPSIHAATEWLGGNPTEVRLGEHPWRPDAVEKSTTSPPWPGFRLLHCKCRRNLTTAHNTSATVEVSRERNRARWPEAIHQAIDGGKGYISEPAWPLRMPTPPSRACRFDHRSGPTYSRLSEEVLSRRRTGDS